MEQWDRRIVWRQGDVLSADAVVSLGLVANAADARSHIAVVVSHDCDLAQEPDVEPVVEVIIGQRVGSPQGQFTHAKNPRRLHVPATDVDSTTWIELTATSRRSIPKLEFFKHAPSEKITIASAHLSTLQHWLAARYRRSAFPDEFDRRLRKSRVAERLSKILEPSGDHIIAVFFDVDGGDNREHEGENDPFMLSIDLVYSTANDPTAAEATAQRASLDIKAEFNKRCFDEQTRTWRNIELQACTAISDEALTYAMSRKLKRWNADHVSLRAEPPQPMMTD